MEVLVEHLGAVQFEVKARNHTLICDQPAENKGFDEGMTPPELFLASLGSCAAFYAVEYLKRNDLLQEGCKVRVTADKAKAPARLDNFHIEVELPESLTEDQIRGVDEAVHRCLIHNTLLHPPKMDVEIRTAVLA
jgi:putative redox protein